MDSNSLHVYKEVNLTPKYAIIIKFKVQTASNKLYIKQNAT